MINVLLHGDHWNRQPLAYAPIRERLAGRVQLVETAEEADLALCAHPQDLVRHGRDLGEKLARRPSLRAVLLSQDPAVDLAAMAQPFVKYQTWSPSGGGPGFGYAVLNHFTCDIFDTQALPYRLLCDTRFLQHYRPLFDRNAGLSAADWKAHWRDVVWDAAFLSDAPPPPVEELADAEREIWGLAGLSLRIGRHCKGPHVLREIKGSDDDIPEGQDQGDWHAAELARLDFKCRHVSAIESVHQRNYVTERIYDAFAVGAVPLYIATKDHAVTGFVGKDSWRNLAPRLPGKSAQKSQPFDAKAQPGEKIVKAYVETQAHLASLVSTPALIEAELDHLALRLETALLRLTQ